MLQSGASASRFCGVALIGLSFLSFSGSLALGQAVPTSTWNTTTGSWSTGPWINTGSAPTTGGSTSTILQFGNGGSTAFTSTDDFNGTFTLAGLIFGNNGGQPITINSSGTGSVLSFGSTSTNILTMSTSSAVTINVPITLTSTGLLISNSLTSTANLTIGSLTLGNTTAAAITISGANAPTNLTIAGDIVISGSHQINSTSTGLITIGSPSVNAISGTGTTTAALTLSGTGANFLVNSSIGATGTNNTLSLTILSTTTKSTTTLAAGYAGAGTITISGNSTVYALDSLTKNATAPNVTLSNSQLISSFSGSQTFNIFRLQGSISTTAPNALTLSGDVTVSQLANYATITQSQTLTISGTGTSRFNVTGSISSATITLSNEILVLSSPTATYSTNGGTATPSSTINVNPGGVALFDNRTTNVARFNAPSATTGTLSLNMNGGTLQFLGNSLANATSSSLPFGTITSALGLSGTIDFAGTTSVNVAATISASTFARSAGSSIFVSGLNVGGGPTGQTITLGGVTAGFLGGAMFMKGASGTDFATYDGTVGVSTVSYQTVTTSFAPTANALWVATGTTSSVAGTQSLTGLKLINSTFTNGGSGLLDFSQVTNASVGGTSVSGSILVTGGLSTLTAPIQTGAAESTIFVDGTSSLVIASTITGNAAGVVSIDGGGTVTLSPGAQLNTNVVVLDPLYVGSSAALTTSSTMTLTGTTMTIADGIASTIGALTNTGTIASVFLGVGSSLATTNSLGGRYAITMSGNSTLTFGISGGGQTTTASVNALTNSATIVKTGAGISTYAGAINLAGGTLRVDSGTFYIMPASGGSLTNTNVVVNPGGNFTVSTSTTTTALTTTSITLQGGTFGYTTSLTAATNAAASLALNLTTSTLSFTQSGAAATSITTFSATLSRTNHAFLTLAGSTASLGSATGPAIEFTVANTSSLNLQGGNNNAYIPNAMDGASSISNGIQAIVPYIGTIIGNATTSALLTYDNSGTGLRALIAGEFLPNSVATGANVSLTTTLAAPITSDLTINSLSLNAAGPATASTEITVNTGVNLTISGGVILATGGVTVLTGGTGKINFGNNSEGIINTVGTTLETNNSFADGSVPMTLVKTGGSSLLLIGTGGSYTGGTYIESGSVVAYGINSLGNGGVTLAANTAGLKVRTTTVTAAFISTSYSGATVTTTVTAGVNNTGTLLLGGALETSTTFAGILANNSAVGTGTLAGMTGTNALAINVAFQSANTTLTLTGTNNTFTGGLILASGILAVPSNLSVGGATNPVTFSGGTLQIFSQAGASFSGTQPTTVSAAGGTINLLGNLTATLGGVITVSPSGVLLVRGNNLGQTTGANLILTTSTSVPAGQLLPWLMAGTSTTSTGQGFAYLDPTTGAVELFTSASSVANVNQTTPTGDAAYSTNTAGITGGPISSLTIDNGSTPSSAITVTGSGTLDVSTGAIQFIGSATGQTATISGFSGLTSSAASGWSVFVGNDAGAETATIASPFTTGGSLTKLGAGTLVLTGAGSALTTLSVPTGTLVLGVTGAISGNATISGVVNLVASNAFATTAGLTLGTTAISLNPGVSESVSTISTSNALSTITLGASSSFSVGAMSNASSGALGLVMGSNSTFTLGNTTSISSTTINVSMASGATTASLVRTGTQITTLTGVIDLGSAGNRGVLKMDGSATAGNALVFSTRLSAPTTLKDADIVVNAGTAFEFEIGTGSNSNTITGNVSNVGLVLQGGTFTTRIVAPVPNEQIAYGAPLVTNLGGTIFNVTTATANLGTTTATFSTLSRKNGATIQLTSALIGSATDTAAYYLKFSDGGPALVGGTYSGGTFSNTYNASATGSAGLQAIVPYAMSSISSTAVAFVTYDPTLGLRATTGDEMQTISSGAISAATPGGNIVYSATTGSMLLGSGTTTINALLFGSTTAATYTLTGGTLAVNSGLIAYGVAATTISAGSLVLGQGVTYTGNVNGTTKAYNEANFYSMGTGLLQVGVNATTNAVTFGDNGATPLRVVKSGGVAGSLLLWGPNTYSGGTVISSGTVDVRGANALGTGGVTFAGNNAALRINTGQTANANVAFISTDLPDGAANLAGSYVPGIITTSLAGTVNITSSLTLGGANELSSTYAGIITQASTATAGGGVTGFLGVNVNFANAATTLTLTGTSNDFTGGLTLSGGKLAVGSDLSIGGAASLEGPANQVTFSGGTLQLYGSGFNSAKTMTSNAATASTINVVSTSGNAGAAVFTGPLSVNGTLTATGSGTLRLGSVTVNGGGTLQVGSVATNVLTISSGLTLNDTSVLGMTFGSSTINLNSSLLTLAAGTETISLAGTVTTTGDFVLINNASSIASTSANLVLNSTNLVGSGYTYSLVSNSAQILLHIAGGSGPVLTGNLTWTNASADGAWNLSSVNWLDGATPVAYADTNTVTFTDTGAGTVNITTSGVLPTSVTVTNSGANTYTFSGGAIGGATGLTKLGTGTLVVANLNTFTGATNIAGGVISLTGAIASPTISVGGTLAIGASNALTANASTPTVTLSGGTLSLASTVSQGMVLNGSSGTVNLANGAILSLFSGLTGGLDTSFAGTIGGSGVVSIGGPEITTLGGANTYTGGTNVNNGGLTVLATGSLASGSNLTIAGSSIVTFNNVGQNLATVINGSTLSFSAATGTTTITSLTGAGTTSFAASANLGAITVGTVSVGGALTTASMSGGSVRVGGVATITTFSGGSLTLSGATSAITTLTNTGTLTLTSTNLTVGGGSFGGTITGSGGLTDNGALTLASANGYSGGTTIAGTVLAQNATALGTGAVTVNGGGVLNISTFTGNVLTISGALTLNSGATVGMTIGQGTINLNSHVLSLASGSETISIAGTITSSGTYVILAGASGISGGGALTFNTASLVATGFNISEQVITSSGLIEVIATNSAAPTGNLTWTGATNTSWDFTTPNWIDNTLSVAFANGNTVTFTDTGAGTVNITTSGVLPANTTVNSASTYTFSGGAIGGSGGLTKLNTGTLFVANNNTYTGGTTVSGGLLSVLTAGSLSSSGNLAINNTGSASFANAQTLGTVTNSSTATVGLSFTNAATLSQLAGSGTSSFASTANIATLSGGNVTVTGVATIATVSGGNLTLSAATSAITSLGGTGAITLSGTNLTVSSGSFGGTLANGATPGQLSVNGAFTMAGTDNLSAVTLSTSGVLSVASAAGLGTGTLTFNGGTLSVSGNISDTTGHVAFNSGSLFIATGDTLTLTGANIAGNINQTGSGTLVILGNYTGTTNVGSGSTLNASPGSTGNIALANGATLDFTTAGSYSGNVTLSSPGSAIIENTSGGIVTLSGTIDKSHANLGLAGPGSFWVNGTITGGTAGTDFNSDMTFSTNTTLSSQQGYSGPTTISSGATVWANVTNALPTNTILNLGDGSNTTGAYNLAGNTQTLAGIVAFGSGTTNAITSTASGGQLYANIASGIDSYSGLLTGSLGLHKEGSGTLELTGASNTYSGATTVDAGTLQLGVNSALPSTTTLSLTGSGTLDMNGHTQQVATLESASTTATVTGGAGSVLDVSHSAAISSIYAGVISGQMSLAFDGVAGSAQVLSGTSNSYTGTTDINSGALIVNGALTSGGSTVTVHSGATLEGTGNGSTTGVINRAVVVNSGATLAPGDPSNSVTNGLMHIGGNLTVSGVYNWSLTMASTSGAGTNFDQVTLSSGSTLTGAGGTLQLAVSGAGVPTNSAFWQTSHTWAVANGMNPGNITSLFALSDPTAGSYSSLGSFSLELLTADNAAGAVLLDWNPTAVPEPGTLLLGTLAAAGLGLRSWRRRRSATPDKLAGDSQASTAT